MNINSNEFAQMYTRLYKVVFYFVILKLNSPEDAKDIASEVFLTAFRTWKEMPENDDICKKYLLITAKARVIDHFRLHHTNFSVNSARKFAVSDADQDEGSFFDNISSDEPLPEYHFEQAETRGEAMKMLNLVSGSDRDLLISRYIQDLSYKEIAEVYDIKEQTARKKVERALIKIQEQLKVAKVNK
jgi:RNA polymerase sigma-70 factor, ECF subfamily